MDVKRGGTAGKVIQAKSVQLQVSFSHAINLLVHNSTVYAMTRRTISFPEDILHLILEEDPVTDSGPYLIDPEEMTVGVPLLQHRYNMALVCKTWHDIAIRYLYRDILVHKETQLPPLFRTMNEYPNRAQFVRTLVLCLTYFKDDASYALFEMCTNVHSLYITTGQNLETDCIVMSLQMLRLEVDNALTPNLLYRAAECCGKTVKTLDIYEAYPRSVEGRQSAESCKRECDRFNWTNFWASLKQIQDVTLTIGRYLPFPAWIPSNVRYLEIDTTMDREQAAMFLRDIAPPTLSIFTVKFPEWPPPPLPNWTRPSSPSNSNSERCLEYIYPRVHKFAHLLHYDVEIESLRQVLREYTGGGLFKLVMWNYETDQENIEEKEMLDSIMGCLLEMKGEGRFDDVRLLLGLDLEPWVIE